jgi:hypothetical protein
MDGVMLGRGHGLEVFRVVALHPAHEIHRQARGKVGILPVGFLAAPPARIAEDVDVGAEERQSGIQAVDSVADRFVVLGPALVGNGLRDLTDQTAVPGRGQADDLRKNGGDPGPGHAVPGLAPPVVLGDSQMRDGGGFAFHLGDLFA